MNKVSCAALVISAFVIAGCASKPEPTFGQLLGDRAGEYRAVKKDWQAGASLKASGEKDIKKGEDMIKRGQRLIEDGQSSVKRGETRVQQGSERMQRAETSYTELKTSPAIPTSAE